MSKRTICDLCGRDASGSTTKIKVIGPGIKSLAIGINADGADLCRSCAKAIEGLVSSLRVGS